jgi:hypothetical protein
MSKRSDWSPTPESVERHLAILGWDAALSLAYRRDTTKLSAYLRSDLPLDADKDKREALADLIDRRIHRKVGKGRKPGCIPSAHPDKITEHDVARLARNELRRIRQRNGGKLPHGSRRAAITHACQRFGDAFHDVDINIDQVLMILGRGPRPKRQ